jgi:hypothetical protein
MGSNGVIPASSSAAEWLPDVFVQSSPVPSATGAKAGLPEIRVNGRELRDVSAEALEAVNAANDPAKLFARAGVVVRVDRAEDGRPMIVPVTDVHFRGEMTRAANFYKLSKSGGELARTAVSPPMDAARDILSRPVDEVGFPALETIAEAPFIRPDGVVVATEGYDPATRTFYAPVGNLKEFFVPDRPTADDIDAARALIEDAIGEFPFEDEASKANAVALFITPEGRHAILGNVPMALVDEPQAGSGKTLFVSIVSEKTTGSAAAMKAAPIRDDDEWRKTLTATIQAGQCLTIFDNLDHVLNSPSLALALTARTWTDRVLGCLNTITLPQRTVFIGTGNNITLGGDLPRRCYRIRLNAQSSEPWRNRKFRHPDLPAWIRATRGRLLSAVLTLARAWFVAGCPEPSSPSIGSFEQWCRAVGGILQLAGISGFLGNVDELYKQADPTMAAWEAFLTELYRRMPQSGFKGAEVAIRVREDIVLRGALPEDLGDLDPVANFQRRLGKALLKRVGRRYGAPGVHLIRVGTNQGAVVWAAHVDKEELLP